MPISLSRKMAFQTEGTVLAKDRSEKENIKYPSETSNGAWCLRRVTVLGLSFPHVLTRALPVSRCVALLGGFY